MKAIGLILLVAGIGADAYFFSFFDTTVDGTYNAGLMNTRICGVIGGGISWVVGTIMLIASRREQPIAAPVSRVPDSGSAPAYVDDLAKSQTLSPDPYVQWLRDCARADHDGRPRPPKPG